MLVHAGDDFLLQGGWWHVFFFYFHRTLPGEGCPGRATLVYIFESNDYSIWLLHEY